MDNKIWESNEMKSKFFHSHILEGIFERKEINGVWISNEKMNEWCIKLECNDE